MLLMPLLAHFSADEPGGRIIGINLAQ